MTHQPTRSQLLTIARELKAHYGPSLSPALFRKETGFDQRLIRQHFESWAGLCRAIGLHQPAASRSCRRVGPSADELRRMLRSLAAELGEKLTLCEFCRQAGISPKTLCDRVGPWRDFRASAGLRRRAPREPDYTDDDLMADLMQVYLRAGRFPSYHEHKLWGGRISATTIQARYRTWRGARQIFELHRRKYFQSLDPNWSPQTPVAANQSITPEMAANILRILDAEPNPTPAPR